MSRLRVVLVSQVLDQILGDTVEEPIDDQVGQVVSTDAENGVDGLVTKSLNAAGPVHDCQIASSDMCC